MIQKIVRLSLAALPILAVVLIVAEFLVTNELAGLGQQVQKTDATIDTVRQENDVLRQKVASASSLLTIEEKAHQLGFSQSPNYIVIGREEFALHQPR